MGRSKANCSSSSRNRRTLPKAERVRWRRKEGRRTKVLEALGLLVGHGHVGGRGELALGAELKGEGRDGIDQARVEVGQVGVGVEEEVTVLALMEVLGREVGAEAVRREEKGGRSAPAHDEIVVDDEGFDVLHADDLVGALREEVLGEAAELGGVVEEAADLLRVLGDEGKDEAEAVLANTGVLLEWKRQKEMRRGRKERTTLEVLRDPLSAS